MEKIYVLDTNVLLHDPMALSAFHEHRVVIPMTVLEELDHIKDRRDKDVSREARIAINAIDKILFNANPKQIQEGVEIPTMREGDRAGTLAIFPDQLINHDTAAPYLDGSQQQANDNRIINVALHLQLKNPEAYVCLVTKDINMRLKAKGSGLENVEDYRRDRVLDDIQFMAKGYEHIPGNFWSKVESVDTQREGSQTIHILDRSLLPAAHVNQFIYDDQGFVGLVKSLDGDRLTLLDLCRDQLMHQSMWGLQPRNMEQAMAFFLISQPSIDMTVLTGPAGSGKTLIALAYGLHAILEEKRYDKLIVARSTPPIAEDIGFLPGTEEEKMAPWLAAFDDNLEVLHGTDESPFSSIDYVKDKANIQFKSLNFMRGRSFNNAYIVIDEAQGLTQFQLKSIITRVGANSKIVVLGNLAQIDNKYISPLTSGLTYLVEKSKNFPHAGIMHVNGIERSRLAAFAEENL
ncbi:MULTISPECIES: PhoH family protein [Spongiibacter]|uniref:PhoH family protein n=2 Tax=Spongiibacteraceae TaxID=1706375 RepID=UPI0003B616BD|nr:MULTISPECIES: PhoH family protein [Spongiibacter]MAY39181.1 ribonuclease [Spongiibacter sp.]MBI57508.1 ribonuclease [Spongiibacter sp.]|tara:strand:+ start:6992 stop:8377 length:1386 start_codon:yes stop_codon:yes gene_type:complete